MSKTRRIHNRFFLANSLFWAGVVSFDGLLAVYVVEVLAWPKSQMFLPAAIMHICIGLFEIPTGAFGDAYGRIRSCRIGFLVVALSFLFLFILPDLSWLTTIGPVLFAVFFALGWTFYSGALTAWVVDQTKKIEPNYPLSQLFSRSGFFVNLTLLVSSALYSVILLHDSRLSWLIAAFFTFFAGVVSFATPPDKPRLRFRIKMLLPNHAVDCSTF